MAIQVFFNGRIKIGGAKRERANCQQIIVAQRYIGSPRRRISPSSMAAKRHRMDPRAREAFRTP